METFFSISQQTAQFLLAVAMGAVLGIAYDIFRVLRIIFPIARKSAAVCVADIIFMSICGVAVFAFSVIFCRGEVRFFCIAGAVLGFVLYIFSLGNLVTGIIKAAVNTVCKILRKVYSAVFVPAVKLIHQKNTKLFVHSYENEEN